MNIPPPTNPHCPNSGPDESGHVWTCLDMSGRVWTCLDMSGHVKTCPAMICLK